ncbi:hypothetical protein A3L22_23850 [Streptomyces griseus subsp. griseus]|nr:hypothetical protein A3L22_23850 [Streptomyces griseus subsp. griseus]
MLLLGVLLAVVVAVVGVGHSVVVRGVAVVCRSAAVGLGDLSLCPARGLVVQRVVHRVVFDVA